MCIWKSSLEEPATNQLFGTHLNGKTNIRRFDSCMTLVDTAKRRHDDGSSMPQCRNPRRERAANVGESTRFCKRYSFGCEIDDVQFGSSYLLGRKNLIWLKCLGYSDCADSQCPHYFAVALMVAETFASNAGSDDKLFRAKFIMRRDSVH